MPIPYIFISLIFATLSLRGADIPHTLTFTTEQLKVAYNNPNAPAVENVIDFNKKETSCGKTFQQLFDNARKKQVPWLVFSTCIMDHQQQYMVDHFDLAELLAKYGKEQHYHYRRKHFATHAATERVIRKALALYFKQPYVSTHISVSQLCCLHYNEQESMPIFLHNGVTTFTLPDYNHEKESSELSCTMAIRIRKDYRQLLPLLTAFDEEQSSGNSSIANIAFLHTFWTKTYVSLPHEQQIKLQQYFTKKHVKKRKQCY